MLSQVFRVPFALTALALLGSFVLGGAEVAAVVAILAVLEISLSFDNAVVNAKVLERMEDFWARLFLTVGIVIAVFGMRLVFPLLVVAVAGGLGPLAVLDLAVRDPAGYAARLEEARPAIAAYGGTFLLMIFLEFLFDPDREVRWLRRLEGLLAALGRLQQLSVLVTVSVLLLLAQTVAAQSVRTVLVAGLAGLATYLAVNGLSRVFAGAGKPAAPAEAPPPPRPAPAGAPSRPGSVVVAKVRGRAAFFLFVYLQVLDASFSFDGVIGAFAVTTDLFVIALGLGVGAVYIRAFTVFLVRRGTLAQYVYLEHGAHYAIGALAVLLFVGIEREVPELVTGLIGVGFLGLAMLSSVRHRRRVQREAALVTGCAPA